MRIFLCVALAFAVGCSAVPASDTPAPAAGLDFQGWIPGIFADAWECADANVGLDYKFGAHMKMTDWARVGVFDYADFSALGIGTGALQGEFGGFLSGFNSGSDWWDMSMTLGAGMGASGTIHTWQVLDLASSVYFGWTGWTIAND